MNLRDYYNQEFRSDLAVLFCGIDVPSIRFHFGNDWMRECSLLSRVPESRRPALLVCLYFTVLVDQAMHTHFFFLHRRFEELTRYPKFLVGFGHEAHINPLQIVLVPIERRLVTESEVRALVPEGMRLFVAETDDFFRKHMTEISTFDFFSKLLGDRDVAAPYTPRCLHVDAVSEPLDSYIATQIRRAVGDSTASD
jgi:hypothetical protein